jgi:hypothetical protein
VLRRRHGVAAKPPKPVTWLRGASVLALVGMGLWGWVVVLLEDLGDTRLLLPLAQAVLALAILGGVLAAGWQVRQAFRQPAMATRVMSVTWLLAFVVLLVVGWSHHLIGFNQNY